MTSPRVYRHGGAHTGHMNNHMTASAAHDRVCERVPRACRCSARAGLLAAAGSLFWQSPLAVSRDHPARPGPATAAAAAAFINIITVEAGRLLIALTDCQRKKERKRKTRAAAAAYHQRYPRFRTVSNTLSVILSSSSSAAFTISRWLLSGTRARLFFSSFTCASAFSFTSFYFVLFSSLLFSFLLRLRSRFFYSSL